MSKKQLLCSEIQKESHITWQNAAAQRLICPAGGGGITLIAKKKKKDSKKVILTVFWGKEAFEGLQVKGRVSSLNGGGEETGLLEPPQRPLHPWRGRHIASGSPPGLLIGMCHIRGLSYLGLFQNSGPSVFQAVTKDQDLEKGSSEKCP